MTKQGTAPETHVAGTGPAVTTRRPFAAPVVEDLGRLQALTQLQGATFIPIVDGTTGR